MMSNGQRVVCKFIKDEVNAQREVKALSKLYETKIVPKILRTYSNHGECVIVQEEIPYIKRFCPSSSEELNKFAKQALKVEFSSYLRSRQFGRCIAKE